MRTLRHFTSLFAIVVICWLLSSPMAAQQLVNWYVVGSGPNAIAVNPVTNKTYVVAGGLVTVIDNASGMTINVPVGTAPGALAINTVTNKIYVANQAYGEGTTITIIDGATNGTTTINLGQYPRLIAVNEITNKIYVPSGGGVTVVDGETLATQTIPLGTTSASSIAINPATNTIYVAGCSTSLNCNDNGIVSVIDGVTNNVTVVDVSGGPVAMAIDSTRNLIYVSDGAYGVNAVSIINGSTLSVGTVSLSGQPGPIAVNPANNKIYTAGLSGLSGCVWIIDGNTLSVTSIIGPGDTAVAVDSNTNQAFVVDGETGTVTVFDGSNNSKIFNVGVAPHAAVVDLSRNLVYVINQGAYGAPNGYVAVLAAAAFPLQFVPVTPCRLVDTRRTGGAIQGGTSRSFDVNQLGGCNIPTTAKAYSLNITAIPPANGTLAYLTIWPTGENQPAVSTMNSPDGRTKANAAVVPFGVGGAVSVYVSNTSNVVLDINGYFAAPEQGSVQYYPLPPCRVVDTRNSNGPLGGPNMGTGQARDFPVLQSSCLPQGVNPAAYSLNYTVVPNPSGQSLAYLTTWPKGEPQPTVSTLNNPTATIVANAAIVPAGTGGDIEVYTANSTALIIDIDGYFSAPGQGGLSMYPVDPCRVLDTRQNNGQPFGGELTVDVVSSVCAPPANAAGYVFNATVVPAPQLSYLTLWPDGQTQPVASTLNALDGYTTSNMAIVPTNNGSIDAYAAGLTQLILDISGYFAP
jgi:DNA-binding beta-propeller fold protein YncE